MGLGSCQRHRRHTPRAAGVHAGPPTSSRRALVWRSVHVLLDLQALRFPCSGLGVSASPWYTVAADARRGPATRAAAGTWCGDSTNGGAFGDLDPGGSNG